ncbi:MAG: ABC transporter permease [Chitinophagaceae bacterium]|nr:ABC transporter permease [Oligoflexus sp.]
MNFSFSAFLALRYLHASRENRHFSFITVLSVLGLTIGVAALIVVINVFDGFEEEMRNRMLQSNSHIVLSHAPAGLEKPDKWERVFRNDKTFGSEIKELSPFMQGETLARNGSLMQGVAFRGVDPRRQERVLNFKSLVTPPGALALVQADVDRDRAHPEHAKDGEPPRALPSVILGVNLMANLNLHVGNTLTMVSPGEESVTTSKNFKVVGQFKTGLKALDSRVVVMGITSAQDFMGMGSKISGFNISIKNPNDSTIVAQKMEFAFDRFSIKSWQTLNSSFFRLVENERSRVGLIVMLVALVAGFNILTAVLTSVTQRQKDISILKALGASNSQIIRIFLFQSMTIGFIGSGIGVILAGILTYILRNYPFIQLPDPYALTTLPISLNARVYGSVSLFAIGICLVSGLYPAFLASRVSPTEGMTGTGNAL